MSAKKGTNRFEAFQILKQEGREVLILEFLAYLKTSRVRHQYVTDLAEMVAKHITERESKPCNKATLLRNPRYKLILLSYMAENHAAGTKNLKAKSIEDPKTQALVMTVQLQVSNLKRDNERLRTYVAHLEAQVPKNDDPLGIIKNNAPNDHKLELEQAKIRFAHACQSLQLVIRHLNSVVSVNVYDKQIIDMTKSRNNVIVDSEIATGFFEWLEANRSIG